VKIACQRLHAADSVSLPFSRSLASLETDRSLLRAVGGPLLGVLMVLWLAWFLFVKVSVYAVSERARLEVAEESYPVEATAAGQVVAVRIALGQMVRRGDLLVDLDAEEPRRTLDEQLAANAAAASQVAALRAQQAAQQQALDRFLLAAAAALAQQQALVRQEEAAAALAHQDAERMALLRGKAVAESEFQRAQAQEREHRAALAAVRSALDRERLEQQSDESSRRAALDAVASDLQFRLGQLAAGEERARMLRHQIGRRRIVAPVSGRVAESRNPKVGSVVREGERLGMIVPGGTTLKAVAFFQPDQALGRIRPGQRARIRLAGFPWARYGSVAAVVLKVASELSEGFVRVDLSLQPDPASRIAFQHGLPGVAEVEVERASPADLALRESGKVVARQ
jgi:membrane fusion protein, adhesin transport system